MGSFALVLHHLHQGPGDQGDDASRLFLRYRGRFSRLVRSCLVSSVTSLSPSLAKFRLRNDHHHRPCY
jgi:hypothetical protein